MSGDIDIGGGVRVTDKTVAIRGRINIKTSDEMREILADALRVKPTNLHVDLSGVSYIDTSGVATLIEAGRIARQQGTRLILEGIHDQPRYFFDITHLGRLFDITQEVGK